MAIDGEVEGVVVAFVEQRRIDLGRGQMDEAGLVEHSEYVLQLGGATDPASPVGANAGTSRASRLTRRTRAERPAAGSIQSPSPDRPSPPGTVR